MYIYRVVLHLVGGLTWLLPLLTDAYNISSIIGRSAEQNSTFSLSFSSAVCSLQSIRKFRGYRSVNALVTSKSWEISDEMWVTFGEAGKSVSLLSITDSKKKTTKIWSPTSIREATNIVLKPVLFFFLFYGTRTYRWCVAVSACGHWSTTVAIWNAQHRDALFSCYRTLASVWALASWATTIVLEQTLVLFSFRLLAIEFGWFPDVHHKVCTQIKTWISRRRITYEESEEGCTTCIQ